MLNYPKYISRCLQIAEFGAYYVAPNPMVGAVLVSPDGTILSEGWHEQYGGPHAEVNCFRAAEQLSEQQLREATLFVSLEPCSHYGKTPPCADLIISKGVKHVVVGMQDPNPLVAGKGIQKLRDAGIEVEVGVLESQCRWLNRRFLCLQEQHRPYVILKWAQTADGYLDTLRTLSEEDRQKGPITISTPYTKMLVHKMRAENMAILVGSRTALLDDPKLRTTRWAGKDPIPVLLDRHGLVPQTAKMMRDDTIVYRDNTDWGYVVEDLGKRHIHSVLVEGGGQVLRSILASGIYDEVHIEVSAQPLGMPGVPAPSIIPQGELATPLPYQRCHMLPDGTKLYTFTTQPRP